MENKTKNLEYLCRILIGDDAFLDKNRKDNINIILRKILNKENLRYNIEYVSDPYELIIKAKEGNYDIVVTDNNYNNEIDGVYVLDELQNIREKTYLGICTADSDKKLLRKIEGKADIYAGQLFNPEETSKFVDLSYKLAVILKQNVRK